MADSTEATTQAVSVATVKPGWKCTEAWATLIPMAIALFSHTDHLHITNEWVKLGTLAVAAVSGMTYAILRTRIKTAAIAAGSAAAQAFVAEIIKK